MALAGLAFLGGCGPDDTPMGAAGVPERAIGTRVDTVVSKESGLLAVVADLHVHPDGRLLVTDVLNHVVQIFGSNGAHLETLGGQGQGPGEFMLPTDLQTRGDSILVVDDGNHRIQVFTSDGEFLESRTWPRFRPPVLGPSGSSVHPTLGMDSVLAVIRGPNGEELARIGAPLATVTPFISMSGIKDQIEDGEVPGVFLNTATAVVDGGDAVWLLISAAARIERYSADGEQLFQLHLDEPEFANAWREFVRRNRESGPNQIFPLQYLLGADVVDDNLWILLPSDGEGAGVVVLSQAGDIVERIRFTQVERAGAFIVDEAREVAYFFIPDDATLVRVPLS